MIDNRYLAAFLALFAAPLESGCRNAAAERARNDAQGASGVDPVVWQRAAPGAHAARAPGVGAIAANPLISLGRPVTGWSPLHFVKTKAVNDGDHATSWGAGKPTAEKPAWVAIDVGKGPSRVLLTWSAAGSYNYEETDYGSPGSYRVETSADSTDGEDGGWSVAVTVPSVTTHAAAHEVDFKGKRWIKLVITGAPEPSPNGVQIDEVEVHDVSSGVSDSWFFMGDSITAFAFGRGATRDGAFAAIVHRGHPAFFPAVINGGVGGEKTDEGLAHLDAWLAKNPSARLWGIGYGTNDAAGDATDTAHFRANLERLVDRLVAAGRVPIVARIPFSSDGNHRNIPRFNEVIDDIQRSHSLQPGPDLYAWFSAHPEQLRDGIHPDERGIAAINGLWAQAMDGLYAR